MAMTPMNATTVFTDERAWNSSIDEQMYQSCFSYKTCDECLNASYTCHFCEADFKCHVKPFGCVNGVSTCHHLEDCERKEPQHVGYGPPPSVVIAVLCLVVTMTCCLCGISAICSVFLRPKKQRRDESKVKNKKSKKPARRQLSELATVEEQLSPSQSEPLLSDSDNDQELGFLGGEDIDVDSTIALDDARHRRDSSEDRISMRRVLFRVMWIGLLIGVTAFMLMFYPRMPDYNVCNRQFEWESIMHSIISLSPKIEYDVLISVINENRFGFVLEQGKADIYHNNTWIGQWNLNQSWEAKAGAISDVIAPIKLDPGYTEGMALWSDFRRNELIFRINASVTGSITFGNYNLYRISSSVSDIEFLVGAEYDRGLCKCTTYLEPQ